MIPHSADRLLGPELSDVDGHSEKRSDTVSVFNGPAPAITRARDYLLLTGVEPSSEFLDDLLT